MMGRRWSLRTKAVAAASLCLLPLLGVVLFILDQSLENSRDQVYETQFAFAEVVARGITQTLSENQDVLTTVSSAPSIRQMDGSGAQEVLAQAKELRPSLTGLFLLDPNKKIIAYAGGIDPQEFSGQLGSAADTALTAGETAITAKLTVAGSDVSVIAMVSPVLAESESTEDSGLPVGAIGSFISVDRLQRSFLPVTGDAESQTSVALVSLQGVVADQGSPSNDTAAMIEHLEEEIAESVAGKRTSLTYSDANGNERQGVLLPVEYPGAAWAVAVTGPSPTTYGPNQNLLREGLIALAVASVITLLLATILGELTARPIRNLTGQAQSIAAGNLEQPVEVVGSGEVASLSEALGKMASRLTSEVRSAESARTDMALQNDVMRELLRRTVRTQEDERRRIAADIHDAVSPLITGALYRVRALLLWENGSADPHTAAESGAAQEGLAATGDLLEQSMDELHNVIFALRPPDLDDVGVAAAVERYVHQINRTGLPCELEVVGEERRLSPETRLSVYRIVQEALHNSLRHAHADEALVKIEYLDDELRVSIRDNGSGFDPESAIRSVSLGLLSMQERATAIGADLDIISRPGAGTIVILRRSWQNDVMEPRQERVDAIVEYPAAENGSDPSGAQGLNGAYQPADLSEAHNA
ncbi:MAG: ATP-binding protein [Thermomicrobiales bacterium]